MIHLTRIVETFPSLQIPGELGKLPVEVSLIAQLGHGAGNHLFASIAKRQRKHAEFINELDEPSAKLASTRFALGDRTSLYSFVVGPKGHPFHRHAGHRIFTAISGSGGAQLRFSTATSEAMRTKPHAFIEALHFVNIPPDCLFTVRFGGETWHQFWPLSSNSLHPVMFALSCHTDELGGNLPDHLKQQIMADEATIPALTELLPTDVLELVQSRSFQQESVATTTLSLDAAAGTVHRKVCDIVRSNMGMLRGAWATWFRSGGYVSETDQTKNVIMLASLPEHSLLRDHLADKQRHHEDTFQITLSHSNAKGLSAPQLLELLLEGFLMNAPRGVSRLMMIRNILVKPLGLRTSPLGCPVSSLLSNNSSKLFANQYPVLDQRLSDDNTAVQVILGANDKHLQFRSCICVELLSPSAIRFSMGNRVHCKNLFGRFYMAVIDRVHRHYIAPTMLRRAVDYVVSEIS